jgi:hypothetical protein
VERSLSLRIGSVIAPFCDQFLVMFNFFEFHEISDAYIRQTRISAVPLHGLKVILPLPFFLFRTLHQRIWTKATKVTPISNKSFLLHFLRSTVAMRILARKI